MSGADPVSNVASAVQEAIAAALAVDQQFNTPAMVQAAVAAALAALRAEFAQQEAALAADPNNPALQAEERKEVS